MFFHSVVKFPMLPLFCSQELELLISGLFFIDLSDLRSNTSYIGYDSSSAQVLWFWEVLEEMDQNRLATFLQVSLTIKEVDTSLWFFCSLTLPFGLIL